MSSHSDFIQKDLKINFFEWLFIRTCAVGFHFSNRTTLTKPEIFNLALKVLSKHLHTEIGLRNTLYTVLDTLNEKKFTFEACVKLFYNYYIFQQFNEHKNNDESLTQEDLRTLLFSLCHWE